MKISCGPSWETKFKAKHEWHRWFAWHPVRIGDNNCRWLEFVGRKGRFWDCMGHGGWIWEYREVSENKG